MIKSLTNVRFQKLTGGKKLGIFKGTGFCSKRYATIGYIFEYTKQFTDVCSWNKHKNTIGWTFGFIRLHFWGYIVEHLK